MSDNKRFPLNYRGIHVQELWGAKHKKTVQNAINIIRKLQLRECKTTQTSF